MPERPDLRLISGSIREALADYDRDALVDILTYVFKEYVVEGPPPLLINQAERLADLDGLSFPELITALQTRLDLPELSLFDVDGDQVQVRVGGVKTPLSGPGAHVERPAMAAERPAPPPPAQAVEQPRPGVNVVETELTRRPPVGGADVGEMEQRRGVAPRPGGLQISGRPGGTMAPPPAAQAERPKSDEKKPDEPAKKKEVAEAGDDDASIRFSLLELD